MIQEKMTILEQVGLSESNLSDNALNASFHSKVQPVSIWSRLTCDVTNESCFWMRSSTFSSLCDQISPLLLFPPRQDPKQRSIMEMFQRSFTEEDDMDEAALLEAANDWGDDCDLPGDSSSARHQSGGGPGNKSNKGYFSR